jgi:uncharacterized phiE125 gp8 family phage protein
MFRPVLVTPPEVLPVTLEEAKGALRVDGTDSDVEIERLIRSAVAHYEGWKGVLGICLVSQKWRQEYGRFEQKMALRIGPVESVAAIRIRNEAGQLSTVASENYALKYDAGGTPYVRFVNDYSAPTDLYEDAPIAIEFVAGWPVVEEKATTPDDIKTAIILHVQKHCDSAAQTAADVLDRVERDLVSKYRRPIL